MSWVSWNPDQQTRNRIALVLIIGAFVAGSISMWDQNVNEVLRVLF